MQEPTAPPGATAPVFYEQEEHAHGDGGTLQPKRLSSEPNRLDCDDLRRGCRKQGRTGQAGGEGVGHVG